MSEQRIAQGQTLAPHIAPKLQTRLWKWFVGTWRPFLLFLFRLRLGWLTDHWLMAITHVGRRSGHVYQTLVYVQHYDPQRREATVVSAFGVTDWYRNVHATPALQVKIGLERYAPEQRILEPEEIAELERQFRRRHPLVARIQAWLMNWPWECSDEEFLRYARSLRGVAFRPTL